MAPRGEPSWHAHPGTRIRARRTRSIHQPFGVVTEPAEKSSIGSDHLLQISIAATIPLLRRKGCNRDFLIRPEFGRPAATGRKRTSLSHCVREGNSLQGECDVETESVSDHDFTEMMFQHHLCTMRRGFTAPRAGAPVPNRLTLSGIKWVDTSQLGGRSER